MAEKLYSSVEAFLASTSTQGNSDHIELLVEEHFFTVKVPDTTLDKLKDDYVRIFEQRSEEQKENFMNVIFYGNHFEGLAKLFGASYRMILQQVYQEMANSRRSVDLREAFVGALENLQRTFDKEWNALSIISSRLSPIDFKSLDDGWAWIRPNNDFALAFKTKIRKRAEKNGTQDEAFVSELCDFVDRLVNLFERHGIDATRRFSNQCKKEQEEAAARVRSKYAPPPETLKTPTPINIKNLLQVWRTQMEILVRKATKGPSVFELLEEAVQSVVHKFPSQIWKVDEIAEDSEQKYVLRKYEEVVNVVLENLLQKKWATAKQSAAEFSQQAEETAVIASSLVWKEDLYIDIKISIRAVERATKMSQDAFVAGVDPLVDDMVGFKYMFKRATRKYRELLKSSFVKKNSIGHHLFGLGDCDTYVIDCVVKSIKRLTSAIHKRLNEYIVQKIKDASRKDSVGTDLDGLRRDVIRTIADNTIRSAERLRSSR